MEIKYKDIVINAYQYEKSASSNYIILLHGFTGSAEDWNFLTSDLNPDFNIIAIDLIGHGKSSSPLTPDFYSSNEISNQIYHIINFFKLKKIILLGYSMGGRAALSFAVKFPKIVNGLILESATAGIENDILRNERKKEDARLSEYILNNHLEKFIDYWMNLDLFSTQKSLPAEKLKLIREQKLKNNKIGLSNSLKEFSTGKMIPLFDQLKNLYVKTLLINGEFDKKYTEINFQLESLFPNAKHVIIKDAGHNTHLEQPKTFISVLNRFLNEF